MGIKIDKTEAWSFYQDYDVYFNNFRGVPGWDDCGEFLGRYSPGMLELSFENSHYYFNTTYTQHLPSTSSVSAAAASAPASASSASFLTAEDAEIEDEVAEMVPYHTSNYANYHKTHDVPIERNGVSHIEVYRCLLKEYEQEEAQNAQNL